MSEKRQFRAIKGTRDILPPDSALWNRFEQTARNIFESYGFGEIRLPIFEETDLFARSIGADTDVVGKEMYTFEDRDESSVSLRPEATASVARAYIEHGMHTLPGNVKLYYIGPMFRRERPQKGRYRQFYQIGAEVLGQSDAPAIDAEVLEMLVVLFKRAGLAGTTLYINSIGCKECRPKYVELLREELRKVKDKPRPGQPAPHRDESAARPRFESAGRAAHHRKAAAHLRSSLRRLPRAFRQAERRIELARYHLSRKLAPRPRPRLLHAHHIRSHRRRSRLAERRLRRRPLRRSRRTARWPSDERHRLRDRHGPRNPIDCRKAAMRHNRRGLAVYIAWMAPNVSHRGQIARKLRECGLAVELPPEEMKFKKSLGLADKLGARYAAHHRRR